MYLLSMVARLWQVVEGQLATMPEHRYSRKLFVQEWNVKPRRGRQRCKVVDNLFSSLGLDKQSG